jgi:hypothetical protein
MGRSAQALLGSLDQGLELAAETSSYVYLGPRYLPGWSIELVLVAAVIPFLVAAVDLFAFVRRRRIRLFPALRSFRRRLAFWAFAAGIFWLFGLVGIWPGGASVPPDPGSRAVTHWPILGLGGLAAIAAFAWLIARERLIPRRPVALEEEVAGHTAALLALAVLALLVAAVNPFALLFVLPSLHAWLWLPDLRARPAWLKGLALGVGFAGPVLLLASLAIRFGLGFDVLWYLPELVSLGYVPLPLVLIFIAWLGVAGQLLALTAGRYAPYPSREERGRRARSRPLGQRLLIRPREPDTSQPDRARAPR